MKKIKSIVKILPLVLCMSFFTSCDKWLNVRPESEVGEEQLFRNEQGYIDALYGVYANLGKTDLYGGQVPLILNVIGKSMFVDESNDDYYYYSSYSYQSDFCREVTDKVWERLYYCVMLTNNILAHLEKADPTDFTYYDYLKGESLALRAYIHYEIMKMFAPRYTEMPDYLSIPYKKLYSNDIEPQKKVREIYELILADLNESKHLLSNDVVKTGRAEFVEYLKLDESNNSTEDILSPTFLLDRKFRMNYYGVVGTMARVYLDMGKKEEAYECAMDVLNSQKYRYVRDEDFKNDDESSKYKRDLLFNDEIVFGLFSTHTTAFVSKHLYPAGSVNLRTFIPGSNDNNIFAQIFNKVGDIRILLFEQSNDHQYGQMLFNRTVTNSALNDKRIRMITLHEMCMIAAEAKPNQAYQLLKDVSSSRHIDCGLTENSPEFDVLKFVSEEYRREYIGEGYFWYMFKRNHNEVYVQQLNSNIGNNIKNLVLPLPQAEIEFGRRESDIWK